MAYIVSLKQFDGPLDLLLTLIGNAKIDIKEIFVSQITEQYLASMALVDELDMDSASEFLQMASTLIEIKSRAMLPKLPKPTEEGELTPEEKLIQQLEEYKRYKEASEEMRKMEEYARQFITKLPEEYPLPPPNIEITGLTLERLSKAFLRVLERMRSNAAEEFRASREVRRDQFTVSGCMARIARKLRSGRFLFSALFAEDYTKEEIVTTFMALLEMVKLGKTHVSQEDAYGEIWLEPSDMPNAQPNVPAETSTN